MDSFDISQLVTAKQYLQVDTPQKFQVSKNETANGEVRRENEQGKYVQPAAIVQSAQSNTLVAPTNGNDKAYKQKPSDLLDSISEVTELKKQILNLKMQADALRKNNLTLASEVTNLHQQLRGKDAEIHELQSLLSQKNENIEIVSHSLEELQIMSEKKIIELEDKIEESSTTMHYLKQCFVKFITSSDSSEKKRLAPVIATILHLDSDEKALIEQSIPETPKIDRKALLSLWNELAK